MISNRFVIFPKKFDLGDLESILQSGTPLTIQRKLHYAKDTALGK